MRRIIPCVLLISLLLSGCAVHPIFAPLANEVQIRDYVRETYGGATLVSSELRDTVHRYVFRDTGLDFEYTVESYLKTYQDGSTIFGYKEQKCSDFDVQYRKAIWNTINLDAMPEHAIPVMNPDTTSNIFAYVIIPDKTFADYGARGIQYLATQLESRDGRHLFDEHALIVRDAAGNWIGRYEFSEGKYISDEIANRSSFKRIAQELLRNEDVVMHSSEVMYAKFVPGLDEEIIVKMPDVVTCYYFRHGYKMYFVADIVVSYKNGDGYFMYNVTDGCSMTQQLHPYFGR